MANPRWNVDYSAPNIPKRAMPWFMQLMMVFAVLLVAGLVYSFWRMSLAPSPTLEVPAQGTELPGREPNPLPGPVVTPANP